MNIRKARRTDLDAIVSIDQQIGGQLKPDYWREIMNTFDGHKRRGFFLVAEQEDEVCGFIIGEIRIWEFGTAPSGWVFAIGVKDQQRLHGIGTQLLEALCAHFRKAGIYKVKTMVARQNVEVLAFFRSNGMLAGPYQELEKVLDRPHDG